MILPNVEQSSEILGLLTATADRLIDLIDIEGATLPCARCGREEHVYPDHDACATLVYNRHRRRAAAASFGPRRRVMEALMDRVDEAIHGHTHQSKPHAEMGEAEFLRHVQWPSGEWLAPEVRAQRTAACGDCQREAARAVDPEVESMF